MFTVSSTFIGDYKLGDNIAYNLEILGALYALRAGASEERKEALRKPIIILNVSIIDAVLYDFYDKVRTLKREGVANLPAALAALWQRMTVEKLAVSIDQARKHDLFAEPPAFYDQLDQLRRLRNRVHIQNEKRDFEPDDRVAFSEARLIQSEQAVEKVIVKMARDHPRNHDYVVDFVIPWNKHFP
ncbi:hypothetical protein [Neoaquamicrobium sediminum]|uniref:hypothetical protein n=1 Tax=Neoaquamicrobium sediminum TaxID=1849104 RepID=UPI003BA853DB